MAAILTVVLMIGTAWAQERVQCTNTQCPARERHPVHYFDPRAGPSVHSAHGGLPPPPDTSDDDWHPLAREAVDFDRVRDASKARTAAEINAERAAAAQAERDRVAAEAARAAAAKRAKAEAARADSAEAAAAKEEARADSAEAAAAKEEARADSAEALVTPTPEGDTP